MKLNIIFLNVVLMPLAIISYSENTEMQIQKLQELQFQKALELSNLGKMIAEKDEFLRSYKEDVFSIWRSLRSMQITILEEMNSKPLSKEEIDKVGQTIEDSNNLFLDRFYEAEVKKVKEMLTRELYAGEKPASLDSFQSMKFILLRSIFEREFLVMLVDKYAACAQELIQINIELNTLKN